MTSVLPMKEFMFAEKLPCEIVQLQELALLVGLLPKNAGPDSSLETVSAAPLELAESLDEKPLSDLC